MKQVLILLSSLIIIVSSCKLSRDQTSGNIGKCHHGEWEFIEMENVILQLTSDTVRFFHNGDTTVNEKYWMINSNTFAYEETLQGSKLPIQRNHHVLNCSEDTMTLSIRIKGSNVYEKLNRIR